jgi:hypothetical protein
MCPVDVRSVQTARPDGDDDQTTATSGTVRGGSIYVGRDVKAKVKLKLGVFGGTCMGQQPTRAAVVAHGGLWGSCSLKAVSSLPRQSLRRDLR